MERGWRRGTYGGRGCRKVSTTCATKQAGTPPIFVLNQQWLSVTAAAECQDNYDVVRGRG